jgi:type IV secretion system protein VirD4
VFEFDPKKEFEPLVWGWRLGKRLFEAGNKRAERKRLEEEIRHTKTTGLPSPDTAIGRRAREALEAEQEKLRNPPPVHGTARWGTQADAEHMIGVRPGNELLLGFLIQGEQATGIPIVARYPGHLLTVAATGQGKSATQIIANLITYRGSMVVIDPKGELYDITGEHRRQFGKVFRLAPLARAGEPPSNHYNPLDELGDERERGNRARRLAEMLIVRQSDKGAAESAYFENEAINLLVALIMAVIELCELEQTPEDKTLTARRQSR